MVRIEFTRQLTRHVECPAVTVDAETIGEALIHLFQMNPPLRGYIVDDHGTIRKHVAVFIDGKLLRDRDKLDTKLSPNSEVYVMQALSGG